MLDEFAIDQQKVVGEHKEQLERLETNYKDEAKKNQEEFKVYESVRFGCVKYTPCMMSQVCDWLTWRMFSVIFKTMKRQWNILITGS